MFHYFLIGIWKTKSKDQPPLTDYFTNIHYNGYAYDVKGAKLTTPSAPGTGGPKYAVKCKQNDVIEMYVDFNTRMLTFAVNGKYYPNGQLIERTRYKAAITMFANDNELRLISYDNIKTDKILKMDIGRTPVQGRIYIINK